MIALTYRAQLQEQHQEGDPPAASGDPADGPVPDGFGDDAIIEDLLGGKGDRESPKDRAERRERERREPKDLDPVETGDDEDPEPATPDDDEEEAEVEEAEPEREAAEADEEAAPRSGKLAEARAAREAGDLDRAIELAFGCKPEELEPGSKAWTQWRKANDREAARRATEARQVEVDKQAVQQWAQGERQKINHIIEQLRPYEEAHECRVAFKRDGDPEALVRLVEKISEMSWAEFNKVALTKTRRSPAERALQQRLQELETRLQTTAQERERATQEQTAQQAYANDIAHIRGSVKGPITQIPKFAERIYNVLVKTRGPLGLTMTVEQAAQRVIRTERKRIESHPFVKKKPGGKVPPKATEAARTLAQRRRGVSPPLRRDSQNNGAKNDKDVTDDDIINDILGAGKRRSA